MAADAPQATSELLVGRRLGLYTITRCVGKGGMGQVYEALHEAPHEADAQRVAVKVLNDALFKDDKILRRFFNEAKALSIVQHQSIVKVFEFGQLDDGTPYILMEFLAGEPLLDYMLRGQRQGQGLALVVVLELGRQLAAALTASHEKGVIHRDLKPENIFVIPDAAAPLGERVKLLDFGIAKFLEGPTRKTTIGTILGTPLYMSPEQCEGSQDLDAKVDVYALGVLLYEMLTGHLPFMADTTAAIMRQHIFKAPPPLAVQAPRVPAEIAGLVHRMLAKPPTERPAMTAVHAALDRFLSRAADMQSGPRQALALQLAAHRQPGVVVGGAAADPMASTIGGAGSGEPARAEPAADLAGAVGPGPWPDAVNPGPGPGAAGDSALPPSPPARADSAEQSAAPRPVSSRPEPAQESRRRALLAGALLILVLALTLAVVSRRPGGSAQAPVYPSAPAAPPSAAALSAAPVSNAAPAPVAPGRAESEAVSPSTGHETAAAGPPVVRSPEPPSNLPKAAKAVKPHPGGKRPHGSAPDRDAPKNREEDPERAWR